MAAPRLPCQVAARCAFQLPVIVLAQSELFGAKQAVQILLRCSGNSLVPGPSLLRCYDARADPAADLRQIGLDLAGIEKGHEYI